MNLYIVAYECPCHNAEELMSIHDTLDKAIEAKKVYKDYVYPDHLKKLTVHVYELNQIAPERLV